MFSWGAGTHGRLGHGNLRDRFSPLMVDTPLRGLDIVQIACYEYHSAVLSGKCDIEQWRAARRQLLLVRELSHTLNNPRDRSRACSDSM